ncbi:MAG TPA: cytochrome P450 [Thermoleophilaceae bacterium]|nr:cytochrome P450 [Thermoleophilaceae bacterium]
MTDLPPGPCLPKWMQTLGFMFFNARFLDGARRRHGDVVTFRSLFDSAFVIVFSPELVKQVFRAPPDQLRAGEANALLGPIVGERSVLLLDGREHMRQRKLLLPPFHGERMRAYEEVMVEATDRVVDSWRAGQEVTLLPAMQELTLEVIERTVFGVADPHRREELTRRVRALLDPVNSRGQVLMLVLTGGRRGAGAGEEFVRARRELDELLFEEIARRRTEPDLEEREDVLSMLLCARDEDPPSGGQAEEPMTDGELRDELLTLLVAGHETTATALAWAFELLMRNPGTAVETDADLDAVVKETLRIRPVISGVGRVIRGQPFELGGYTLPVGMEINPSIGAIHRRADHYPRPGDFDPSRYRGDDAPDTYTWLPFGGGTRRCLGASFATFEMRTVVRRVLERVDMRPAGPPEKGVRRSIVYVPAKGVRVQVTSVRAGSGSPSPVTVT